MTALRERIEARLALRKYRMPETAAALTVHDLFVGYVALQATVAEQAETIGTLSRLLAVAEAEVHRQAAALEGGAE